MGEMKTDPNVETVVDGQGLDLPAVPKKGFLSGLVGGGLSGLKTDLGHGLAKLNIENPNRVDFHINNTHAQGNGETFKLSAENLATCLLYTSPSPRDATLSRMPSSA